LIDSNDLSDDEISNSQVVVFQKVCHSDFTGESVECINIRLHPVALIVASHGGAHVWELRIQKVVALNWELVVGNKRTSVVCGSLPSELDLTTILSDLESHHTGFSGTIHGKNGWVGSNTTRVGGLHDESDSWWSESTGLRGLVINSEWGNLSLSGKRNELRELK
jgi:hypothetical protein